MKSGKVIPGTGGSFHRNRQKGYKEAQSTFYLINVNRKQETQNMKNRILSIFCFIIFLSVFSGCSTDPNEKANALYVEASQIMQTVKVEAKSYSEALESYNNAREKIVLIYSKYDSSNVAVNLMSGQTRISGLTLSEFKELEGVLTPLAEAEKSPLFCALLIAKTIKHEFWKAAALAEIAGIYAKAGQKEKAAELLSQALETVKTINHPVKDSALYQIASSYAEVGQFIQALETTKEIKDEYDETRALADIAAKYAEVGQFTQALETTKIIKREFWKATALAKIAGSYAKAGQKEKAAELLSQALETTQTTNDEFQKARLLAEVAGKYAEAGQKEKAAELLSQALETTKTIEDEFMKIVALAEVAGSYAKAGQKEKAAELLSQALETIQTTQTTNDEFQKARLLAEVAGSYAKAGQKVKAAELLSQALETTKTIEDEFMKIVALAQILGRYAEAGQQPNENDIRNLVQTIKPINVTLAWE